MSMEQLRKLVMHEFKFEFLVRREPADPVPRLVLTERSDDFWQWLQPIYKKSRLADGFQKELEDCRAQLRECNKKLSEADQLVSDLNTKVAKLDDQVQKQGNTIGALRDRNEQLLREVDEKDDQLRRCDELKDRVKRIRQGAELKQGDCWQGADEPRRQTELLDSKIKDLERKKDNFEEVLTTLRSSLGDLTANQPGDESRVGEEIAAVERGGPFLDRLLQKHRDEKKCWDQRLADVEKDCRKWDEIVSALAELADLCAEGPPPSSEGTPGTGPEGGPYGPSVGGEAGSGGEVFDLRTLEAPASEILEPGGVTRLGETQDSLESALTDIFQTEPEPSKEPSPAVSGPERAPGQFSWDLDLGGSEPGESEAPKPGAAKSPTTTEPRTLVTAPLESTPEFYRVTQAPIPESEPETAPEKEEPERSGWYFPPSRKPDQEPPTGSGTS